MKTLFESCLFFLCIFIRSCSTYEIPLIQLDLISSGFTISFPDEPGIKQVFYVIQINEECPSRMDLLLESKKQLWATTQSSVDLKANDKLKISLLVNYNGEAFSSLQYIIVGNNDNKANFVPKNDAPEVLGKCSSIFEPQVTSHCEPSKTVVKGQTSYCQNQVLFEENFDGASLDRMKWSYDIRNLLTGKTTEEFVVFDNREENIFIKDGYLNIKPSWTNDNLLKASINFGTRCTPVANVRSECNVLPMPPYINVAPVNSSHIHTRDFFRFKHGRVEIKAKFPKGNWLMPYIMLQNYGPFVRKQIRIAFARGNDQLFTNPDSQNIGGRRLYGGIVTDDEESRWTDLKENYNVDHYGNSFHIYTLMWTNDAIAFGVDNEVYGEIRENLSDFDDEFFLSLGVSAGGHLDFPDNLQNGSDKPWQNTSPRAAHNFWQGFKDGKIAWNDTEAIMKIDYVKISAI